MRRVIELLWLAPAMPLLAAGLIALLPSRYRRLAATLAIGAVAGSLVVSVVAFLATLKGAGGIYNFEWFQLGRGAVELGWILNPLTSVMQVMVALVSLLIFIYSVGYMHEDSNFTRFFCFLAFFSAAMLGVVIANSLLLLFVCWELVGLASYLLIGFWYHRPSAAAAAKKAFIVTRIGDLGFLIGMVLLYSKTGTLLLYNEGQGFLEGKALALLAGQTIGPLALTTVAAMLLFSGAVGKSGQVPLHVWLPDAMEGPTPVSALIHAATMVAAGVFLIARVYPLMATVPERHAAGLPQIYAVAPASEPARLTAPAQSTSTTALRVVTWTGVFTALFAASIACAQNDIKRILAYSTVSQLGFMMAGLGTGGVAVGMLHLITHAFFKALLFLGAGSVIHGCHDEQDIRRMGGLGKLMPATFATYAVGMLALSGFPLIFSGFWSKDAILHSARHWAGSHLPFFILLLAALLTAFYMTRQVCYVFLGNKIPARVAHESPPLILIPLVVLAAATVLLVVISTPVWPWFEAFIQGSAATFEMQRIMAPGTLSVIALSSVAALFGIGVGLWLFRANPEGADALFSSRLPDTHRLLGNSYFVDQLYDRSIVAACCWTSLAAAWLDRTIISGVVNMFSLLSLGFSWASRLADELLVNKGFDESCAGLRKGGGFFNSWQTGRAQTYLRLGAAGVIVLGLLLIWGCR